MEHLSASPQQWLIAYGSTLVALLALDALWLTLFMAPAYKATLGDMMLSQPRLVPAVAFYLLFTLGVVVFAVLPALHSASWQSAAVLGAVLGLIAYATYDLTSLAIFKGWTVQLALIDVLWGAVLSCAAGVVGYAATSRWG
jgi:uncharacterized membrane protein